jgi:hypothetical protein
VILLKRTALAIILVSILIIAGVAWLILSQTGNQVENQAYDVRITEFNWTGTWGFGPAGTLYGHGFNVTLHNLGTTDTDGVKVEVKLFANDSALWSQTWFDVLDDDGQVKSLINATFRLNAGEIRVFDGTFMRRMEFPEPQGEVAFKVICMLNSTVLDELTLPETEDRTYDVEIADFKWTSSWGPGAGGIQWGRSFNITLQNLGNKAVEGLSVDVKLLVNNTEIFSWTGLYGPGIIGYTAEYNGYDGKLNANEIRELRGDFMSRLDVLDEAHVWNGGQKEYSVRVMMNKTIIDELLLPFT